MISRKEWDLIFEYYLENAPEKLEEIEFQFEVLEDNSAWNLKVPDFGKQRPDFTTLLSWNQEEDLLYLGDRYNQLFKFDVNSSEILDSIRISSPASDLVFRYQESFDLLTMGVMDPSNFSLGKLMTFNAFGETEFELVLDSLTRPVHVSYADLTQNGEEELIVCHFGNHVGKLMWYERSENGQKEHYLNVRPGARRTIIEDVNGDGKPDILALMTQAKEGVYVYINQGGGEFKEEQWLEFPPVYGSSDFVFEDMNGDGFKDIILVSGDNADQSPILKPYHGLRIFLNDGENQFEERYFQAFHGASGLIVEDFSGNGHKDISVISYFPNIANGMRQNFLFFENHGDLELKLSKIEELGQWSLMTLESGDVNKNGKKDLILGCFDFASMRAFPMGEWVPYLILENMY